MDRHLALGPPVHRARTHETAAGAPEGQYVARRAIFGWCDARSDGAFAAESAEWFGSGAIFLITHDAAVE